MFVVLKKFDARFVNYNLKNFQPFTVYNFYNCRTPPINTNTINTSKSGRKQLSYINSSRISLHYTNFWIENPHS